MAFVSRNLSEANGFRIKVTNFEGELGVYFERPANAPTLRPGHMIITGLREMQFDAQLYKEGRQTIIGDGPAGDPNNLCFDMRNNRAYYMNAADDPTQPGSEWKQNVRWIVEIAADGSNTMNLEVMKPIRSGQQLILHDYMVAVE